MQPLENALDDVFKKAPQMPEPARKSLATALPWLSLIAGIFSLFAVWGLYTLVSFTNSIYSAYGYVAPVTNVMAVVWISLVILLAQAILFLVAFPSLRTLKKKGWDLLFYGALLNIVYDVVFNVFNGYLNFGQLLFSLIGAAVGLYLLFQVRGYFGGANIHVTPAPKTHEPAETTAKKK
jgi:hypothetical protein